MDAIYFKVPRLLEETVRVEFWDLPYFYEPIHFHQECQITYILEGQGTIIVGSEIGDFTEGDLFFLGKNIPHVLRHDERYYQDNSKLHAKAISIFFLESTFRKIFDEIPETNGLDNLLSQSKYGIHVSLEEAVKIAPLIKRIKNEGGVNKLLSFLAILNMIAKCKKAELISTSIPDVYGKDENKKLNRVFCHIMSHFHETVKLDDVAELANMTPTAFCRFFKIRTNKTFSRFLIDVRINRACKLLSDGNSNVLETYSACGYNNSSNFHRHFKRNTGYTPREFKHNTRQRISIDPLLV